MMSQLKIGNKAPDVKLPATDDQTLKLAQFKGKNIVLYFYPKDNTPGCTLESQNFRDKKRQFDKLDTVILGVSRDNLKSHANFKAKQSLNFDLLSDEDETLCQAYDVIKLKNMYGKKVRGIERSTFLIDRNGKLVREWRKVKVDGHVDEVLAAVKELAT